MQIDTIYARTLTDMTAFLRYLVTVYGPELYKEKQQLSNLIADLYTGEERQKRLYRKAISEDNLSLRIYELTRKVIEERKVTADAIAFRFAENNFMREEIGRQVTYDFVYGLGLQLSTSVGEDDGEWEDCCGAVYSKDRTKLISVPGDCEEYAVLYGTVLICDSAFQECSLLEKVTIPSTVTALGESVFAYCESLQSIEIPNSVMEIGNHAFQDCN